MKFRIVRKCVFWCDTISFNLRNKVNIRGKKMIFFPLKIFVVVVVRRGCERLTKSTVRVSAAVSVSVVVSGLVIGVVSVIRVIISAFVAATGAAATTVI